MSKHWYIGCQYARLHRYFGKLETGKSMSEGSAPFESVEDDDYEDMIPPTPPRRRLSSPADDLGDHPYAKLALFVQNGLDIWCLFKW